MNSLSKIDPAILAEITPTVTREAAQAAADKASIVVNLEKIEAKEVLGKFMAPTTAGNLITELEMEQQDVERARGVLMKIIDGVAPFDKVTTEQRLDAIETLTKMQKSGAESKAIRIKAAEIAAIGTKNERRKSLAPQSRVKNAIYVGEGGTVNLPPQEPTT